MGGQRAEISAPVPGKKLGRSHYGRPRHSQLYRRDAVLACHSTRSEESAFAGPSILFATCRQQTAMKLSSKSRFLFHPRFAGKKLLFCLLFTAALSSGSDTPARRRHTQIRYIMGTLCEITAYPTDQDKDNTDIAINAAFDELKRIDSCTIELESELRIDASELRGQPS